MCCINFAIYFFDCLLCIGVAEIAVVVKREVKFFMQYQIILFEMLLFDNAFNAVRNGKRLKQNAERIEQRNEFVCAQFVFHTLGKAGTDTKNLIAIFYFKWGL